ncbi:MAG TPA: cache domain-containing protein [Methanolinea sp.]|nr:cache domain-containing protein [Methanolinea sp.]HQK55117.1 cache domain-containing protein [Methanolinea sp.]
MRTAHPLLLFAILLIFLLGAGCLHEHTKAAAEKEVMLAILGNASGAIQYVLGELDTTASMTAASLEKTGLAGADAEAVLEEGIASHPLVLTMITYDVNGTVVAAEPESVKVLVGQNLSGQEVVQRALAEKVPLMSAMFPLAEGGDGVVIEHPVRSSDGEFLGVLSTMFMPYDLIRPFADDESNGTPYTFMVIETGGHILYDPDPDEVGKETFGDALYAQFPEIDRVARRAAANRSGYDTYIFYGTGTDKVVRKETFWSTVGLHGTEWRVMVIGES